MHSPEWTVINDEDGNADGDAKACGSTLIIEGNDTLEHSKIIVKRSNPSVSGHRRHRRDSIRRLGVRVDSKSKS